MGLEEVEDGEHEDPNQIDEMPEKTGDLDAVGHVLGIAEVELFAEEEEIGEDDDAGENVQAVQAGDQEISGENPNCGAE